jgi:exodeoxyribonuclease VII small subunit
METKELTYSQAMAELESIVDSVESNGMGIDDLTEKLKRAQQLVKFCRERLHKTEEEVKKILSSDDLKTDSDAAQHGDATDALTF